MGNFIFSTGFDATISIPSSGCLTTPPTYHTSIDPHTSRSNMAFQPGINHIPDSYFFDEAISTSPISIQMEYSFSPCSPRTVITTKFPQDSEPLQAALPILNGQQKATPQLHTPAYPPDVPVKLEDNVSKLVEHGPKSGKRGRKPKRQRKASSKVVKPEDSDVEVHPREPCRRRILERNRIAATKCRMRKRSEASALAAREQEMEERNRQLSRTFDELTAEIYDLKSELLRHTDCNCVLIQKYIAHEAMKSVRGLTPCPSPSQPNMMPFVGYQSGSNGSRASVSVASETDSYGIRTPEIKSVPPIWPDPSLQGPSSPETMFDMTMEPMQKEHIPVSSQPMPGMPLMHEHDYPGSWVGTGPPFQPIEGDIWGANWEFR
ncbi:hypothetical protein B0T10DRAFT_410684 [Thelonectria olida]|uniref:BZIP domain-containing protein n=1 Tax=Thelonectria olida TaxID=1576542 RepID=A0A9P8VXJ1_9HYPO|nr:hypothetical protein B0T10DRAFT_410684 [Thelonectria olida]